MVNLIGLATGLVFGAMAYLFGPGVRPFTLLSGNILIMTFLFTYGHLRHSRMWIPRGRVPFSRLREKVARSAR